MAGWPPVILGIQPKKLQNIINKTIATARTAGTPGADTVKIVVLPAETLPVGQHAALLHISGAKEEEISDLWKQHLTTAIERAQKAGS